MNTDADVDVNFIYRDDVAKQHVAGLAEFISGNLYMHDTSITNNLMQASHHIAACHAMPCHAVL